VSGYADPRFPLAESIYARIADDIEAIERGAPSPLLDAVTPVTAELLRWWFHADHRDGRPANFHSGQRDAILAIVYAHEVLASDSLHDLYDRVAPDALLEDGRLGRVTASPNGHPKYAAKMATGTGKTWVLNALLIWQHLNNRADPADPRFSSNFLIVAPGLVVYDRLLDSFQGRMQTGSHPGAAGSHRDFRSSDIAVQQELFLPPDRRADVFAFLQSSVVTKRDIGREVTGGGVVAITNWHLLSGDEDPDFLDEEPDVISAGLDIDERAAAASFVPLSPGVSAGNSLDTLDRRQGRGGAMQHLIDLPSLVVFNDEAHHIHRISRAGEISDVEWQRSLNRIAEPKGRRFIQVDFSATPYNEQGSGQRARRLYFDHIVVDFPLHAAMRQGLVKALAIDKRSEIAALSNAELDFRVERDEAGAVVGLSDGQRIMITAGLKKLGILEEEFVRHGSDKHPKLLIMTEDTKASAAVVRFLREYGLSEEDVLQVDSNRKGELGDKEWRPVKEKLFGIDRLAQPRVIVSVLMLREGFDVNNICVIVPLRSAGSGILAEQTVGRGLRLMWRGDAAIDELKQESRARILNRLPPTNYLDVLFIVEHPRFVNLYEELLGDQVAVELTEEIDSGTAAGDLETLELKADYRRYDFEVPVILRDAEEELSTPSIDPAELPVSKYPVSDLLRRIGTRDRWSSEDAQTGTRFGDYRVDGGVMTATGYNDYLARMANRISGSLSRVFIGGQGNDSGQYTKSARYPLIQIHKALLVGWIDRYIRERAFGPGFDPLADENWRILLVGDVPEEIAGLFSSVLIEGLKNVETEAAQVDHHWTSEIRTITTRTTSSVEVHKSLFDRIPIARHSGGLERSFIEWADADSAVEAIVKIDEYRHWFLHRAYLKADGMAAYYSPDFLVRTADGIFLVETKAQSMLHEANVLRKKQEALSWVERINALDPQERSGRFWSYVLLGERAVKEWRSKGGGVAELLLHARLIGAAAAQPTLL